MSRSPVVYNFPVPSGAGQVSGDFRPERVSAPSARGSCFANMQSVGDLNAMCASAPSEHQMIINRIKARGKVRDATQQEQRPRTITVKATQSDFSRGSEVRDKKENRRGIIIHAHAGHTKKSRTPVHKVCDKSGRVWLAKETDLKLLY